jgi:hypothetical protein
MGADVQVLSNASGPLYCRREVACLISTTQYALYVIDILSYGHSDGCRGPIPENQGDSLIFRTSALYQTGGEISDNGNAEEDCLKDLDRKDERRCSSALLTYLRACAEQSPLTGGVDGLARMGLDHVSLKRKDWSPCKS